MGNSNLQQPSSSSVQLLVSSLPSHASQGSLQPHYHTPLYGRHTLNPTPTTTVVKTYSIGTPENNQQFMRLLHLYQQVRHPAVVQLLNVEGEEGREGWRYVVEMEWCRETLGMEMEGRREKGFQEGEIVGMVRDVVGGLLALNKAGVPWGELTPDKIGLQSSPHPKYCLTSDLLMNPQLYHLLPPPQLISPKPSSPLLLSPSKPYPPQLTSSPQPSPPLQPSPILPLNCKSSESLLITSLGKLVLQMASGQSLQNSNNNSIAALLSAMRRQFSYQLVTTVQRMVGQSPEGRIWLSQVGQNMLALQEKVKQCQLSHVGEKKKILKRGYDCPTSLFFHDPLTELPAAKSKLLKLQTIS